MSSKKQELRIGVIGCGHWGPNHVRVFSQLDRTRVVACADLQQQRLDDMRRRFPTVTTTTDYRDLLYDSSIDAVVVSWFGVASTDLLDDLRAMERLDVRAVGDCLAPRRAIDAIWDGFRVGFEI